MPLTKEEFAKGARVVYINTPETQKMLELFIETDKTWKRLNRAFIRGRIDLEQVRALRQQFETAIQGLKDHLREARQSSEKKVNK
jgi:hypothetical protein